MKLNSLKGALLLGILSFQLGVFAQEAKKPAKHDHNHGITYKSVPGPDGNIRCHTMEADSILRANNPVMLTLDEEEAILQKQIAIYKANQANGTAKKVQYTIPVIFHVFTDGSGAENISAAQVQAQIDQLNIDFGDLAGSSYPQSADTEIQFCAAVIDENGTPLAEPGINRITQYGQGPFSSNDFDNSMKAATIWNPNDYFNVWVANLSGGLLGYAQFPNNSGLAGMNTNNGGANTDGCVILYSTVGSVSSPFPGGSPYNLGRTLTHEAGHWLGLRHIWGDGGCGASDFCNDTPDSDGSNFGCPNTTSCSSVDMVENYMDYTNDACMDTYTADQKTRMQTVMSVSPRRSSLGSSMACTLANNPDDVGVTAIVSPNGTICGSTFTPEVTVANFGTNSVSSFTLTFDVDGSGTQTYSWTGSLGVGGSTTVTLPAMTSTAGNHTFNSSTSVPNGNTDTNGSNDGDASSFTLTPSGQSISFIFDTDCYGEESVYELYDDNNLLVYSGGNNNVTLPVTATQGTAASDPGAYPNETTITEVWCLANGCYEFTLWDAYGDGINGSSVTGCNTDGDYSIEDGVGTVLASMQAANGAFTFSETVTFCVGDGNIGIDELSNSTFLVYPNPSEGIFNVQLINETSNDYKVAVLDVTGRVVLANQANESTFKIDLSGAATGTYTVVIESENNKMIQRVIVK